MQYFFMYHGQYYKKQNIGNNFSQGKIELHFQQYYQLLLICEIIFNKLLKMTESYFNQKDVEVTQYKLTSCYKSTDC